MLAWKAKKVAHAKVAARRRLQAAAVPTRACMSERIESESSMAGHFLVWAS